MKPKKIYDRLVLLLLITAVSIVVYLAVKKEADNHEDIRLEFEWATQQYCRENNIYIDWLKVDSIYQANCYE